MRSSGLEFMLGLTIAALVVATVAGGLAVKKQHDFVAGRELATIAASSG